MKKTTYAMIAMTVLVLLFVSACGSAAAPAADQNFAPACPAASSGSCAAPDVKDTIASDRYCVDKVPYENISIPDGVTFQVLEPDKLTCVDNGTMAKGKHVIECHGTENWSSKVTFTNTACGGSNLQTGTGKCQEGSGYDAGQNCCAPLGGGGSVTITVNMGECPN
jgi:hypothetical protein